MRYVFLLFTSSIVVTFLAAPAAADESVRQFSWVQFISGELPAPDIEEPLVPAPPPIGEPTNPGEYVDGHPHAHHHATNCGCRSCYFSHHCGRGHAGLNVGHHGMDLYIGCFGLRIGW